MKVKFVGWKPEDPDSRFSYEQREAIFELEDTSQISVYLESYPLHWPASDRAVIRYLHGHICDEIKRHQIRQQIVRIVGEPGTTSEVKLEEDNGE